MDYLKNAFFPIKDSGEPNTFSNTPDKYPQLIEPGIRYIVYSTLQKCHNHRVKIYNWIFNVCIFLVFMITFSGCLYYCYKKKPSPEEKYNKMVKDQNYILSKIRFYQNEKLKKRENEKTTNITSLPTMGLESSFSSTFR
jgi:hypothetical protein